MYNNSTLKKLIYCKNDLKDPSYSFYNTIHYQAWKMLYDAKCQHYDYYPIFYHDNTLQGR